MGARVTIYDPAALGNARRLCPDLRYAATVFDAARDAQIVLMLTEWPEFVALNPDDLGAVVTQRNIIDGRNALAPDLWRDAGWEYRAPGVTAGPAKARLRSERALLPQVDECGLAVHARRRRAPSSTCFWILHVIR